MRWRQEGVVENNIMLFDVFSFFGGNVIDESCPVRQESQISVSVETIISNWRYGNPCFDHFNRKRQLTFSPNYFLLRGYFSRHPIRSNYLWQSPATRARQLSLFLKRAAIFARNI